jgi:hypothetical protein
VTPRNAPSVINATFNFRQQGREGAERFNGVNVWGRTPGAKVLRRRCPTSCSPFGSDPGRLARLAGGRPMTNAGIMSFAGRTGLTSPGS